MYTLGRCTWWRTHRKKHMVQGHIVNVHMLEVKGQMVDGPIGRNTLSRDSKCRVDG